MALKVMAQISWLENLTAQNIMAYMMSYLLKEYYLPNPLQVNSTTMSKWNSSDDFCPADTNLQRCTNLLRVTLHTTEYYAR